MKTPKCDNVLITEMVNKIDSGDYRIPRFQRNFVWDIKKSAALLDSILKCYPIGALIIWQTKTSLTEIKDLGGVKIPGKDTGKYTSYIIDGQQRITSLYFAFKGLETSDKVDFSSMCISLIAKNDDQIVFDTIPAGSDADDFVLVKDLFSAAGINGSHQSKRVEYYKTLMQYELSVIKMDDSSIKLDEVVEVFERLNLGGKPLNLFSIIDARTYKPETDCDDGFDLNEKYLEFSRKLRKSNYGEISSSTFLLAISACLIEKCSKKEILNNLDSSLVHKEFSNIETALERAITHLQGDKYGVKVSNLLPYEKLLIPFTYFHYINKIKPITVQNEKYLCDYFWRCVIGKRYNTATETYLNADLCKIKDILNGKTPVQDPIVLSPDSLFDNGAFSLTSAFSLGMLCLMAQKNPQSLSVGQVINITNDAISSKAQRQYHHFFPMKSSVIKSKKEYEAIANNVVNIVFMDALTNNQIKNNNPSSYMSQFISNPKIDKVLSSHFICKTGYGIENDDFDQFINARSKALYKGLCEYLILNSEDIFDEKLPRVKKKAIVNANDSKVPSEKIGEYVKAKMRMLSNEGHVFTDKEIKAMTTPEWSIEHFHTTKPFMKIYIEGSTTVNGKDGRRRFWSEPFSYGEIKVLITKEWYERQRKYFDLWFQNQTNS